MRKRFRWVMVGLSLLASLVFSPVALGDHGDWEGYCEGDQPVFTHPPTGEYSAHCYEGSLIVRYPPPEFSSPPGGNRSTPPDFYQWVNIRINGKLAVNPYTEVDPYIVKNTGRTVVPIRFMTEALGGVAEWNEADKKVRVSWNDKWMEMIINQRVEIEGKTVLMGSPEVMANGVSITLDQPPMILDGRTLVPVRAITEAFGAQVSWIQERLQVSIELEGAVCPASICDRF